MADSEWTRPAPRKPRPAGPRTVLSIFYGYPDDVVARWCGITPASVRQYKSGKRKPSRTVVRLFMLHREGRVLDAQWKGWQLRPDSIVDPDGNETTRGQLHNYFWIVQLCRRLAYEQQDRRRQDEFERLLELR